MFNYKFEDEKIHSFLLQYMSEKELQTRIHEAFTPFCEAIVFNFDDNGSHLEIPGKSIQIEWVESIKEEKQIKKSKSWDGWYSYPEFEPGEDGVFLTSDDKGNFDTDLWEGNSWKYSDPGTITKFKNCPYKPDKQIVRAKGEKNGN